MGVEAGKESSLSASSAVVVASFTARHVLHVLIIPFPQSNHNASEYLGVFISTSMINKEARLNKASKM